MRADHLAAAVGSLDEGKRRWLVPAAVGLGTCLASSSAAAACVPVVTLAEYQPSRVLISVLLTPAASTRISTSPGPGAGTGTSR